MKRFLLINLTAALTGIFIESLIIDRHDLSMIAKAGMSAYVSAWVVSFWVMAAIAIQEEGRK